MNTRRGRLAAALLVLAAAGMLAPSAWAQGRTDSADFCTLVVTGELTVEPIVGPNGVEISFTTEDDVRAVQAQVRWLAARSNARRLQGYAPEAAAQVWDLAVPPGRAVAIETLHGSTLIVTDASAFGTELIREWGFRVQEMLMDGECTRLLEPAGEV